MLVVEQWAELRRLHFIERVSVRELSRRTGLHRKTIRRAIESAEPPVRPAAGRLEARSLQTRDPSAESS